MFAYFFYFSVVKNAHFPAANLHSLLLVVLVNQLVQLIDVFVQVMLKFVCCVSPGVVGHHSSVVMGGLIKLFEIHLRSWIFSQIDIPICWLIIVFIVVNHSM
jgi:accessory gene regulator protein AgrB